LLTSLSVKPRPPRCRPLTLALSIPPTAMAVPFHLSSRTSSFYFPIPRRRAGLLKQTTVRRPSPARPTTQTTLPSSPPAVSTTATPAPGSALPLFPTPAAVRAFLTGHAGPDPDLERAGPPYEFSKTQEAAFVSLEQAMQGCARAYGGLSATAALHGLFLWSGAAGHGAPPPGALAVSAAEASQAAAVAFVLWVASAGFSQVAATRGRDVAWLLSGVRDLAGAFGEVAIMGTGLALLHVGVAVLLWPGGALPLVAGLTAAATVGRAATHGRPDRAAHALRAPSRAMRVLTAPLRSVARWEARGRKSVASASLDDGHAGGPPAPAAATTLAPASPAGVGARVVAAAGAAPAAAGDEREFSPAEEEPLAACIASMHVACLARLLQAAAEAVLCVACAATGRTGEAVLAAVGALETAASGGLFYFATSSLGAVIKTQGNDVAHVLQGLGPSTGLARMFRRLEHVVHLVIGLRVWPEAVGLGWRSVSEGVRKAGGWGAVVGGVRGWVGV